MVCHVHIMAYQLLDKILGGCWISQYITNYEEAITIKPTKIVTFFINLRPLIFRIILSGYFDGFIFCLI